jgi:hypothetical protein
MYASTAAVQSITWLLAASIFSFHLSSLPRGIYPGGVYGNEWLRNIIFSLHRKEVCIR